MPVYAPPAFFWWWFHFDAYAPPVFVEGAYIASSGGFASIVVADRHVGLARPRSDARRRPTARPASRPSARCARPGCSGRTARFSAGSTGDYLRHDGPEHVLCFAPTRSGKGVGLVVPTLLTWSGSAIVHDIKGENWTVTAGWRARFGRVLKFDPTSPTRRLQSAAGGAPRRLRGARRPEHRRHAGRSRRRAGDAQPLGEDQPLAAGRRHPARPLRRAGQDAGRRRQLPLRPEASDRDDAARDDDHRPSRAAGRASGDRQLGARAC